MKHAGVECIHRSKQGVCALICAFRPMGQIKSEIWHALQMAALDAASHISLPDMRTLKSMPEEATQVVVQHLPHKVGMESLRPAETCLASAPNLCRLCF